MTLGCCRVGHGGGGSSVDRSQAEVEAAGQQVPVGVQLALLGIEWCQRVGGRGEKVARRTRRFLLLQQDIWTTYITITSGVNPTDMLYQRPTWYYDWVIKGIKSSRIVSSTSLLDVNYNVQ